MIHADRKWCLVDCQEKCQLRMKLLEHTKSYDQLFSSLEKTDPFTFVGHYHKNVIKKRYCMFTVQGR